ncbi:MAG: hypothetical protein HYX20_01965 [Candidatus Yanofskybacteria bacterium]|nr:hypothetical protein [Candidatus Yanofskybacteria bacterium]
MQNMRLRKKAKAMLTGMTYRGVVPAKYKNVLTKDDLAINSGAKFNKCLLQLLKDLDGLLDACDYWRVIAVMSSQKIMDLCSQKIFELNPNNDELFKMLGEASGQPLYLKVKMFKLFISRKPNFQEIKDHLRKLGLVYNSRMAMACKKILKKYLTNQDYKDLQKVFLLSTFF